MVETQTDSGVQASDEPETKMLNRIIKRFGGRHLIFRTQLGGWRLLPRSYALVSDFCGPIWFFYGLGQIWLTHKKYQQYDGWTARVPRLGGGKVVQLLDVLKPALTEFTHHCNETGIEGTVVVEPSLIEFHWTFGYSLEKEKLKPEQSDVLDAQFKILVDAFLAAKKSLAI
jgi:hypothetical protein